MKKFRSALKSSDKDEDPNRSALFGSRSKKSTNSASASSNPYAQQQGSAAPDPYAQDTNKYANMGRPFADSGKGPGPGPAAARGGYGGSDTYGGRGDGGSSAGGYGGGYGADRYRDQGGYGGNQGGYGQSSGPSSSRYGASGYGGLGAARDDSQGADDKRDALFGGAKDRYQQKSQQPPHDAGAAADQAGGYGAAGSGYGAYGEDRQLTAEEAEEEDVQATKQQIRFMKQEDVSSTRNALRIAAQAEETGRSTLERLGAQGERIHNTEKNLDLATNHNRVAEEKARELKTLNGSMFAVHVGNPFTTNSRKEKRDQEIMERHREEREARENTRLAAYESKARVEGAFKTLQPGDPGYQARQKSSLAERSKYQFEADSEDDEMENEIDSNLDALSGAATRLNHIARATGKEVDEQNLHIERIHGKSDKVDDMINMNRKRLDRIH